jgi:hypothetical protein
LLHAGLLDLESAFDTHFVSDFLEATGACRCHGDISRNLDRISRELREERLRRWRRSQPLQPSKKGE